LKFTGLVGGGDIFTVAQLNFSEPFRISFDYLGLPALGGNAGDLGGYLGIAYNLNPVVQFVDHIWYAGTDAAYPGLLVHLIDDGQWHSYSFVLDGATAGTFRLMIEDFADAGGVAGDAFFDNIIVEVPEPASLSLVMLAGILVATRKRRRR